MVWLTGDTHGDESRLYGREWNKLRPGDTLLVCGDFGYLWNGDRREREIIEYLGTRRFSVCFIDGTHENYDLLSACRLTRWRGGLAHRVYRHLYHLCRGEVFRMEGASVFVFGGGESDDRDIREPLGKWWREEMPLAAEMEHGAKVLDERGCKVDYVVTHEPPSSVKWAMSIGAGEGERQSKLGGYLQTLDNECEFRHWYFGSMHENRLVTPKHTCLFDKIIPLGSEEGFAKKA